MFFEICILSALLINTTITFAFFKLEQEQQEQQEQEETEPLRWDF
jgi:hypothetical protein